MAPSCTIAAICRFLAYWRAAHPPPLRAHRHGSYCCLVLNGQPQLPNPYSYLSATVGSTRTARRAGR
jgi:hypothetical protein